MDNYEYNFSNTWDKHVYFRETFLGVTRFCMQPCVGAIQEIGFKRPLQSQAWNCKHVYLTRLNGCFAEMQMQYLL